MKPKIGVIVMLSAFLALCWKGGETLYPFPKPYLFPEVPSSVKSAVTIEGASLGRFLFYDPVLSADSSISCSSCHSQRSAFSDGGHEISHGVKGGKTTRNARPLFNLAWQPALFYDGRVATLEDQVSHPILASNEMGMEWTVLLQRLNRSDFYRKKFKSVYGVTVIDSVQVKKSISQFVFSLMSYESKFDRVMKRTDEFSDEEFSGFGLVNNQTRGDCLHCHPTDGHLLMSTYRFSNNGLDDVMDPAGFRDKGRGAVTGKTADNGKFMIPSLRNVALTAPYMHDGRFKTLEEVIEFYSTGVHSCVNIDPKMGFAYQKGARLTEQEKKDIVAFLKCLTDSLFITKKEYSNPFKTAGS